MSMLYVNHLPGIVDVRKMANWWDLPLINNFGVYPDPVGPYPKPDVNIVAPANTPFVAPASGTVSSIDTSSFWGNSVTVQFDNPPNNVAQYYAFNYMSQVPNELGVGNHVNVGDTLAYGGANINNSGGTAAFAFSGGPRYGFDPGWSSNVIGQWINPLLNPTDFINILKSGGAIGGGGGGGGGGIIGGISSKCTCDAGYVVAKNNLGQPICKNQSFPYDSRPCRERGVTDPLTMIANFLNNLQALGPWLSDPIRILKLVAGFMLIGLSIYLLVTQQGPQLMQKAVKAVTT